MSMPGNDQWWHDHWEMVAAAGAVTWAFVVWAWNSMFKYLDKRYATETQMDNCHLELSKKIDKVENELRSEMNHNREINSKEHNDLREILIWLRNGKE